MGQRAVVVLGALGVGVLFAAGLFVSGPAGGVLLLATAVIQVGLTRSVWPQLTPVGRQLRILLVVGVAILAVTKLAGLW